MATAKQLARLKAKRDRELERRNREIADLIGELRRQGTPWADISAAMGISRQAVHKFLRTR